MGGTGLALALVLASAAAGSATDAPAPRAVVLVTIDTLRADHVGALGGPVPTPSLDALAAEGALVEQATTPVPSTGPAHASLLTGLHPWRHGTLGNAVRLDPRVPTLADRLPDAIDTAAFVSSFVLDRRFGFDQGFDVYAFEPTEGYRWRGRQRERFWARGETTVKRAMEWLTEHVDRRFFVWVHLFDPHTPYQPPSGFAVAVDSPVDIAHKSVPEGVSSAERLKRLNRDYRGEVRYADAQVGKLVARLRLLGILDTTAVVVTSDHGEGLGDHGVLEHGVNVYDELVRVPLIVRAPGIAPGTRPAGPAQLEDLAPTILGWLGVEAADLDGVDLGPWLRGAVVDSPRAWSVGRRRPYRKRPDQFFARRWPAKWTGDPVGAGVHFALDADPFEQSGRAGARPPAALGTALSRGDGEPVSEPIDDPEVQRALEALGYLER